jgi:hypothetical protein
MEKLAENDLTYFYLCHVVIVVTAVTTISLPPVIYTKCTYSQTCIKRGVLVFNATFNNISVISWQSVLLVEETGLPRENH